MTIIEQAPAKINLALDIIGRRADGYHELCSVMQTVSLCDTVTISDELPPTAAYTEPGSMLDIANADLVPDGKNLALKALRRFQQDFPLTETIYIHLKKRIPLQAGLAGGSADAAGVLRGLNRLCGNPFSVEALCQMGADLGADVPFCVHGGTCLCEGVGERLTPLVPLAEAFGILLAKPVCGCSTPEIFRQYDADPVIRHDAEKVSCALKTQNLSALERACGNALENAAVTLHPEIERIRLCLRSLGAIPARMSGSGPTVWGLFPNIAKAAAAKTAAESLLPEVHFWTAHACA